MLREQDFARWLDVETPLGDPSDILHSRLPHPFVLAPVSPAVNNSRHKSEALLAPVHPDINAVMRDRAPSRRGSRIMMPSLLSDACLRAANARHRLDSPSAVLAATIGYE